MAMPLTLRGVYIPLITPFDDRDRVDLDALERLAAGCLDAGARGLIALATTGEPTSLDDDERAAVVASVASVCAGRGFELIVGAGTNDTRTTLARHEALADVPAASGSLAVVPYYVRPSEAGIVAHFQAVAAHSPCRSWSTTSPTAPAAAWAPTRCASSPRPRTSPGSKAGRRRHRHRHPGGPRPHPHGPVRDARR